MLLVILIPITISSPDSLLLQLPLLFDCYSINDSIVRWLATLSSAETLILMNHYNQYLSVNAIIIVSKNCPIIGVQSHLKFSSSLSSQASLLHLSHPSSFFFLPPQLRPHPRLSSPPSPPPSLRLPFMFFSSTYTDDSISSQWNKARHFFQMETYI